SGAAGRRAVAQLVLTATSLQGVDAVQLTIGGEPVEAPLPTGELTSAPLTAADYAVFLTAAEAPSPAAVPAPPS
ncbi:MAG TPA: GerMN domain-containing protein, partial [Blastococcus sp.]|nr:GerMN domain-containing protein [Blastococcus sp.]